MSIEFIARKLKEYGLVVTIPIIAITFLFFYDLKVELFEKEISLLDEKNESMAELHSNRVSQLREQIDSLKQQYSSEVLQIKTHYSFLENHCDVFSNPEIQATLDKQVNVYKKDIKSLNKDISIVEKQLIEFSSNLEKQRELLFKLTQLLKLKENGLNSMLHLPNARKSFVSQEGILGNKNTEKDKQVDEDTRDKQSVKRISTMQLPQAKVDGKVDGNVDGNTISPGCVWINWGAKGQVGAAICPSGHYVSGNIGTGITTGGKRNFGRILCCPAKDLRL